jgi:hypothetical protein
MLVIIKFRSKMRGPYNIKICHKHFVSVSNFPPHDVPHRLAVLCFSLCGASTPFWVMDLSSRNFAITHIGHPTLCRTPLDERSARSRDLYLTAGNTQKRQTSMPREGFETKIPGSDRLQNHALDSAGPLGLALVMFLDKTF